LLGPAIYRTSPATQVVVAVNATKNFRREQKLIHCRGRFFALQEKNAVSTLLGASEDASLALGVASRDRQPPSWAPRRLTRASVGVGERLERRRRSTFLLRSLDASVK
jgi:hypothetical protein